MKAQFKQSSAGTKRLGISQTFAKTRLMGNRVKTRTYPSMPPIVQSAPTTIKTTTAAVIRFLPSCFKTKPFINALAMDSAAPVSW